jgi:branched-subunit amino acid aminotransferase/4-amino-4-deoxychorismate lyase
VSHLLFIEGRLRPADQVKVSPLNGNALFGEGLFESLPVYAGRALFLKDHLERLEKGCRFLGWPLPSVALFEKAIRLFYSVHPFDFVIRFNLSQEFKMPVHPRSRGEKAPKLWAFIRPLTHGARDFWPLLGEVGVSPWTVPDATSVPNQFKWAFYMMTRQAYRKNSKWREMVRVNGQGYAVDGAGSSVLWFDGQKVQVPPRAWVGLEGVTQKKVTVLCRQLGIKVIEKAWRPDWVVNRGELIFAGSGVGVMGAKRLQGKTLKSSHSLALRLWQHYRQWALSPDRFEGPQLIEKP